MHITVLQAALIALSYYLAQGPWLMGLGFFTLYRPLVAGLVVGVILGNPVQGTIIGATINLIYLGFISAGGALPGDPALAGHVATALALTSGLDPQAALALAVPIGLLGTLIWFVRMTVDSLFVHLADRYAEQGSTAGVSFANVVPPQILLFIISFVPVFLAVLYGPPAVQSAINLLGASVLHVLIVIGGMMPAVGIAMNLRAIGKPATMPFFLLGFVLVMYLKLDIIAVAILGGITAIVINQVTESRGGNADGIAG